MSYKEFSYFYDYFNYNADYDALFEKILELAKEGGVKNGIVCDLGCGTGELAFRFNDAGFDVIAVDYSDEMLDVLFDKRDELEAYEIQILKQDITQILFGHGIEYMPVYKNFGDSASSTYVDYENGFGGLTVDTLGNHVMISGATISSNAIKTATTDAFNVFNAIKNGGTN